MQYNMRNNKKEQKNSLIFIIAISNVSNWLKKSNQGCIQSLFYISRHAHKHQDTK